MISINIENIARKRERNNRTTLYVGENIIGRIVYSDRVARNDPNKYEAYSTIGNHACIGRYLSEEQAETAVYCTFEAWLRKLNLCEN